MPGVAPGLAEAHARFGRIPLPILTEPAISAARQGVTITEYQAELGGIVSAILTASSEARALFCDDEKVLAGGSLYRNPALADVLEVYAHEGPRFVTEGEVAQAVANLTEDAGHLTTGDMRGYQPEWRTPLMLERGGVRIVLNPPPSLGGSLIAFALQILPYRAGTGTLVQALEATTRARIDAAVDSDPQGLARLFSSGLVERYRAEVIERAPSTRGTTHISVVDADGMGAALTLSNGEGCGLIAPGTGIMPNNMMGEADLMRGGFETWPTDTRLSSMMAPMAVDWPDGRRVMLGSGGSNRIRTALLQVVLGLVDRGMPLAEAIEIPRLHVEGDEHPKTDFEDLGGDAWREAILAAAPDATVWPDHSMFFGGVHGAETGPQDGARAAGDPRRAGAARTG